MSGMTTIHLDFESRSTAPFGRQKNAVTAYQYARHPETYLWCMCYAVDDGPVRDWTPSSPFPAEVLDALADGAVFAAHNANFEWCIWNFLLVPRMGLPPLPFSQMDCTATRASVMALPRSLGDAGRAMGLYVQKDEEGAKLMQRMAKPRKPRKDEDQNGVYWYDDPERIARLIQYCRVDVESERALDRVLRPLTDDERAAWMLDHKTNFHGVLVDTDFASKARNVMDVVAKRYNDDIHRITEGKVSAVTEVGAIKDWLEKDRGMTIPSLDKTNVQHLLDDLDSSSLEASVLHIRQEAGKSSVAKLDRFIGLTSEDGRMRENFLHHGANTGRLAGKGAQLQNLPSRGGLKWKDAEKVIGLVKQMRRPSDAVWAADMIEVLYGSVPTAISSCLRGCIMAPPGKELFVADYSNIEGRVAAWLGGEKWKLDAFRKYDTILCGPDGDPLLDKDGEELREGPDLYKVTAGQILGITPQQVSKSERNVMGKVPELALGFGGGVGAFQSMAKIYGVDMAEYWPTIQKALDEQFIDKAIENWDSFGKTSGIPEDEWQASESVKLAWRARHPGISRCWYDAESMAISALKNPGKWYPFAGGRCAFGAARIGGVMFLISRFPSGRRIYRADARLKPVKKFGKDSLQIWFKTVDGITKRWIDTSTYGGDLFQSFVQGIACDIMRNGWKNVEQDGFDVVLSVHDEVGAEGDVGRPLSDFIAGMERLPAWAEGCPVSAAGYVAKRYRKD